MEIKPWDEYFLDLAKTCASRSNCLRAQVGAVIVGQDKKLRQQGITEHHQKLNLVLKEGNVIEYAIIFHLVQDMKLVVQFMPNKMRLFKQDRIVVKMLLFIFGDIILFVFFVKDLLFNQELLTAS